MGNLTERETHCSMHGQTARACTARGMIFTTVWRPVMVKAGKEYVCVCVYGLCWRLRWLKKAACSVEGPGSIPGSEGSPGEVFLPGESHGQRSVVGYSPRGRKESDTTERLNWTDNPVYMSMCLHWLHMYTCIDTYTHIQTSFLPPVVWGTVFSHWFINTKMHPYSLPLYFLTLFYKLPT